MVENVTGSFTLFPVSNSTIPNWTEEICFFFFPGLIVNYDSLIGVIHEPESFWILRSIIKKKLSLMRFDWIKISTSSEFCSNKPRTPTALWTTEQSFGWMTAFLVKFALCVCVCILKEKPHI
jgi:hypothetical protein